MKRVLFVITERNSANGICLKSVMEELMNNGYKVFCVTNREYRDNVYFYQNGVEFYTVRPRLSYRISSYLKTKCHYNLGDKILNLFGYMLNKFALFFSYFYWPIISLGFTFRLMKVVGKVVRHKDIDIVVPIYTQIDSLIAAKKVKSDCPEIKIVPYFLDAFAAGFGPKLFSRAWIIKRGLRWEKYLLKDVDKIVMMQSARPFYEQKRNDIEYFDKIQFIDLPLFNPVNSYKRTKYADTEIKMLYVGSIPVHIRNPKFFLDAFMRTSNSSFKLQIVGTNTCSSLLTDVAKKDCRVELLGSVSHEKAIQMMLEADILINFGNNNSMMTPSKIFEYMSVGKPIITTAPIEDEPSLKYLKYYPSCLVLYEQKMDKDEASEKIEDFVKKHKDRVCNMYELKEQFYLNTPRAFLEIINVL